MRMCVVEGEEFGMCVSVGGICVSVCVCQYVCVVFCVYLCIL